MGHGCSEAAGGGASVHFAAEIGRVKIKDFNIWMLNLGRNLRK